MAIGRRRLLGGLWMVKIGVNKALWLFGFVQVFSIFGFAWLAAAGHHVEITSVDLTRLAIVIGLEALGVGLGRGRLWRVHRARHPPRLHGHRSTPCSQASRSCRAPSPMPPRDGWWTCLGWIGILLPVRRAGGSRHAAAVQGRAVEGEPPPHLVIYVHLVILVIVVRIRIDQIFQTMTT